MVTLYQKDTYLNKSYDCLQGISIYEYDISSAGANILYYYKHIDESDYNMLMAMTKKARVVALGKMQLKYPEIKENLKESFQKIRYEFMRMNGLNDEDIHSIKKDAIYTTKACSNTVFGNVIFMENKYTSYYMINKMEMYYNSATNVLDIKGIKDDALIKHKEYMIDFLSEIFYMLERSDIKSTVHTLTRFVDHYVSRNLVEGYYRELNQDSMYRVAGSSFLLEDISKNELNIIDISYNYMNILVPLIKFMV